LASAVFPEKNLLELTQSCLSEAADHFFTFRGCAWPLSSAPFGQACFGWTVERCLKVEMAFEADV